MKKLLFLIAVVVINVLHPFLHPLEGGSLDAIIDYINAIATSALSTPGGN